MIGAVVSFTPRGAPQYTWGIPAQDRSVTGATASADGSQTPGECGETSRLPIKVTSREQD